MKQTAVLMRPLTALSLLVLALLGCKGTLKQRDWTKAQKIAGQERKLSHISGMVFDDKFAYVTMGGTLADQQEGTSGVRRVALDSGEVTLLDDGSKNIPQSDLGGMATDEKFVYWNAGGKIFRLSKDGGTPEPLVSEHIGVGLDIAIDNEKIYWANHGYYSSNSPTKASPIYMVSKKGGNAEIFADQQHIPSNLVVDSEFVYWVTPTSILKQAKSGGQPQVVFQATEKEGVDDLTQDAENLYFAFRSAGNSRWALRKISKQGGEPKTLSKTVTLGQIAIDDTTVYFFDEHSLMKDDLCRVSKEGGEVSRLDTGYSNGILIVTKTLVYFTAGDDIYSFKK
jgi:Domain of unknown function (DUF5050)